jgi:hypothetical protein
MKMIFLIKCVVLGALMGTLSGLLGIGGGVVVVPGLVMVLGLEMKKAIAISLAVIMPVAFSGVVNHLREGNMTFADLKPAIAIVVAGMIFAAVGAWLSKQLPADHLKKIFGVLLLIIGAKFIMSKPKPKVEAEASPAVSATGVEVANSTADGAVAAQDKPASE